MTVKRIARVSVAWAVLAVCPSLHFSQEHNHSAPEKLGSLSFPTTCTASVQKLFERSVALLHSFAYAEAERAFRDVANGDPKCAMAHWGMAMSYFHQLWEPHFTPQSYEQGRAEIAQARQLRAASEREDGFVNAASIIFRDAEAGTIGTRIQEYTKAMESLAARFPNDSECQIFYALALISTASPTDKTHANQKKAAAILEPLYVRFPDHPGIAHYLIHAYDNPELARKGLAAARAYSKIAPSAPHALHMPSHIFTQLGMWEDSVQSNLAARASAHEHGDIGEELHAMDYLVYAYLQLGRDAEAAQVLADLRSMSSLQPGEFKIGYAASAMAVRYAIERRRWKEAGDLELIPGTLPQVTALTLWARAVGLARSGNADEAGAEIEKLGAAYEQVRARGDAYWATQVHVEWKEATAWKAHAEGKQEEAVRILREAAEEEESMEKRPVTPGPVVPAREQLGDLLLEVGRNKEAQEEFKLSLTSAPNRRGALEGFSRAKELVEGGAAMR